MVTYLENNGSDYALSNRFELNLLSTNKCIIQRNLVITLHCLLKSWPLKPEISHYYLLR